MKKLLNVYKPIGKTPFEVIQQLKELDPEYADIPIGYAGRLDPMAHGILLLMVGDETKNREMYLELTKEYHCTALLGLTTDSYDVMGLLDETIIKAVPKEYQSFIKDWNSTMIGQKQQPYPPYSSKTVQGKQLFKWARENKLDEIEIPHRSIEIYQSTITEFGTMRKKELEDLVTIATNVKGHFRQTDIKNRWLKFLNTTTQSEFITVSFQIECSTGTYIRSFIHQLGQALGCGAVATEIYRTKVGKFAVENSVKL